MIGIGRLAYVDDSLALQDGAGIMSELVIVKLLDAEAAACVRFAQQLPHLARR